MEVSIVILTKNGGKHIGEVLESIFNQDFNGEFEVIVIDSGSNDITLEIIKKYPVILRQIPAHEFGHGKTRNLGAKISKGEIVVFLTQDAVPIGKKWLYSLTRHLSEDHSVGAVFGKQVPMPDADPINKFRIKWIYQDKRIIKTKDAVFSSPREKFSFSNVNSAVSKTVLRKYVFQEDAFFAEDINFAKKILMAGYKIIYEPEAAVYHTHNFGIVDIFRRYFDVAIAYKRSGIPKELEGIESEGGKYVFAELKFLIKNGYIWWVPYSLLHNISKYLGLKLGHCEAFLPVNLKKKISVYWY